MADMESLVKNLKERGYIVRYFETGQEAVSYLNHALDQKTIGIGGSATIKQLGLYECLSAHNTVFWHWEQNRDEARRNAMTTDIYLSSVNAIAETGEIVNIDGVGNRISSTFFGHQKIYFIVGSNKITGTYEDAVWRARNVAAPQRAKQLNSKTPCAAKADRCYDCKSPGRVCRGMSTLWGSMAGTEAEIILIGEELGL